MKKIEPENKLYRYYAIAVWLLFTIYLLLS
nr:MAG TPA: Protein seqA/DNA Complex-DNA complex, hemimethylated GATC, DNA [Caudoviricetes sp.]